MASPPSSVKNIKRPYCTPKIKNFRIREMQPLGVKGKRRIINENLNEKRLMGMKQRNVIEIGNTINR